MKTERFEMRLDREMLEGVDSWRFEQPEIPSQAQAVRQLVDMGLAASRQPTGSRFSSGEKLIFWLLRDLFKHEKVIVADGIDIDLVSEAISGGHEWALDWKYTGMCDENAVTSQQTLREVSDILNMWCFIERSHAQLSKEEKKQVEIEAAPFGKDVRFRGFSVNDETEHYSTAQFLVNKLGRFAHFKGRELNSHSPSLGACRRMLTVFKPILGTVSGGYDLSASSIINLLKERTHPDNREA